MKEILDLEVETDDYPCEDIRGYLQGLLVTLFEEGESFSGKRPFGNGGWEWDLYQPLVKAGLVEGKLDVNGILEEVDERAARDKIFSAISHMCHPDPKA